MSRDHGLEALVAEQLDGMPGLNSTALFGGWCWLLRGHLVCGARHDGLLIRLGREQAGVALDHEAIEPMTVGSRFMPGWVRVGAAAFADDALRRRLIDMALAFVATLPDKETIVTRPRTRQAGPRKPAGGRHGSTPDTKV